MFAYKVVLIDQTNSCIVADYDQYIEPSAWAKKAAELKAQGWKGVRLGYTRSYEENGISYVETITAIPKLILD